MIAVVPVRRGWLPVGAEEAVAEAHGVALIVGSGPSDAARRLPQPGASGRADGGASEVKVLELGEEFRPGEWARAIAPHVEHVRVVVLPASPDGRDLAPRLAAELARPLIAGAVAVQAGGALVARHQGRQMARFACSGPFVATLLPWSRPAEPRPAGPTPAEPTPAGPSPAGPSPAEPTPAEPTPAEPTPAEPELVEVLEADPASIDLSEADLVIAAGYGIGGPEIVALLARVAHSLGASLGATRAVTDAGWLSTERQIGTTGVSVSPRCYVALGISGAAQHLAGLGAPRHIISANIDRSCPMMAMADLAIVTDVPALVEALAHRLAKAAPQDHADPAAPQDHASPAAPQDRAGPAAPQDHADPAAPQDRAGPSGVRGAGDGGQP